MWAGLPRRGMDRIDERAIDDRPHLDGRIEPTGVEGDGPGAVELPTLDADVYLLAADADTPRGRREATARAVQTLALDTALSAGGDAVWIDTRGYVATHQLARLAPGGLDRVQVARAFTTHQHHTLVGQVARWTRGEPAGPFGEPATTEPAIVVVPAADALYRSGDAAASRRLFARTVAQLRAVARTADVPVVTTRAADDDLSAPLERAATAIETVRTRFGPRFDCPSLSFETVAYPDRGGTTQTTLAFWRELLAARHGDRAVPATAGGEPGESETVTTDRPAGAAGGRW